MSFNWLDESSCVQSSQFAVCLMPFQVTGVLVPFGAEEAVLVRQDLRQFLGELQGQLAIFLLWLDCAAHMQPSRPSHPARLGR